MAGRTRTADGSLYSDVQWHPPRRDFWITPEMITRGKKGEPKPGYSTNSVALMFIGRSAAWLRVRMRQSERFPDSELVLDDWSGDDIHRSPTGDRQFSLADIEKTAHALHNSGSIDDDRFVIMIMIVVWEARLHGLLTDEGL